MTRRQLLVLDALERSRGFLQAHPRILNTIRLAAPTTDIDEAIATIRRYALVQRTGHALSLRETARLQLLLRELRETQKRPIREAACRLRVTVDAVEASAQDRDSHKRQSVGATHALPMLVQRGREVLKELHAAVRPLVRDSRELRAAWDDARCIGGGR